jgi:hypothetical protein
MGRKKKKKKPSLRERVAAQGREARRLGQVLKDEPASLPAEILTKIKRSFRKMWNARGGGLYACGFIVTFVYLEIRMFFADILEANSVGDYVTTQAMEMVFKYLGESFANTIQAFLWPVYLLQYRPPVGLIVLAGLYVVFANFIKSPLERWLFAGEDPPPSEDGVS